MKYLLECRHTGYSEIEVINLRIECPVCHAQRKLLAIECREYHAKCDNCRFGKWFGQDRDAANLSANRHASGHTVHIDYQIRQDYKNYVNKLFGRRVKKYIELDQWLEGKFLSEKMVQLTLKSEFICSNCQVKDHGNCMGQCDCQHREEFPF